MNRKEAEKIQPGALVRYSFTKEMGSTKALVLTKRFEDKTKREVVLCLTRPDRYILTVSWLDPPKHIYSHAPKAGIIEEVSSWDMMVVSHAT